MFPLDAQQNLDTHWNSFQDIASSLVPDSVHQRQIVDTSFIELPATDPREVEVRMSTRLRIFATENMGSSSLRAAAGVAMSRVRASWRAEREPLPAAHAAERRTTPRDRHEVAGLVEVFFVGVYSITRVLRVPSHGPRILCLSF